MSAGHDLSGAAAQSQSQSQAQAQAQTHTQTQAHANDEFRHEFRHEDAHANAETNLIDLDEAPATVSISHSKKTHNHDRHATRPAEASDRIVALPPDKEALMGQAQPAGISQAVQEKDKLDKLDRLEPQEQARQDTQDETEKMEKMERLDGNQHGQHNLDKPVPATPPQPLSEKQSLRSPTPPPPPPKDAKFLTRPTQPVPPSTAAARSNDDDDDDDDPPASQQSKGITDNDDDDRSEIQTIMEQFEDDDNARRDDADDDDDDGAGAELERIMSPRLEKPRPDLLPPRSSSLDPTTPHLNSPALHRTQSRDSYSFTPAAARPGSISGVSISSIQHSGQDSAASPRPASAIFQPPPPSPDPEPTLPFDFHRFLEQLRHRTADPVARFLRSFLMEFGKKQWMVHEQVKIIADFLEFISKKMAQCDVWRSVSDAEFDNAREGMEKLVMNRLYNQTFSPAIPPVELLSPTKGKRSRNQAQPATAPGRKGQHQEDVERDAVIAQKIRIYGWIKEEHLDIPPVNDKGRKFLLLAQQELLKINSYRAPRDKIICVLNCCKVIFGFLKNSKGDQSADSFVPLLIYTVLRANPEHLVSNVQYILRFRNQDKLGGEAGYYISSLMGVVTFVEGLDRTNLTITDEEFERNVEAAVSAIAEGHKADQHDSPTHETPSQTGAATSASSKSYQPHYSEKSAPSRPELTPRNSTEGERSTPRRPQSSQQKTPRATTSDEPDDKDAVSGLLRTIQKPLSTIGRMFSDENASSSSQNSTLAPLPGSTPRLSPAPPTRPLERNSSEDARRKRSPDRQQRARSTGAPRGEAQFAEDAAAQQARSEAAEAQRIHAQEHRVVVETLQGMFPDLDREIISDVVRMKEGRVGLAVDACLALSS